MRRCVCVLFVAAAMVAGCAPQSTGGLDAFQADYARPLPAGQLALRKLTNPAEIPDFSVAAADTAGLAKAIDASLNYMSKPSSQGYYPYGDIPHQRVMATLMMAQSMLRADLTAAQFNAVIRRDFDVYVSVGWDGRGGVQYTGYYTPIFDASPVRTEKFRYPLYAAPEGLAKGPAGEILGLQLGDGAIVPCPARRHLAGSGLLEGRELVWLADAFDVYVAHVQGSARLRMPDGTLRTAGYSATNGHEYRSVSAELVRDGRIAADKVSLQAMREFFHRNPDQIDEYVNRNPRFVFFAFSDDLPRGSLNEPVTAMRTIATDKSVYPRAALAFVQVHLPVMADGAVTSRLHEGFVLDQDTGGAIRAPGRCDIYLGVGDEAGELAGHTLAEGRLYYLFVKPEVAAEIQR